MKVRFNHNCIYAGSCYVCGSVAELSKESAAVLIKGGFASECTAGAASQEKAVRRPAASKAEPATAEEEEGLASFDGTEA